jgi:hypothetical protein
VTEYTGPYDIRVFSNDHKYMRTNGLACIHVVQNPAEAREKIAEEIKQGFYAAAYMPDTVTRVNLPA